MKYVLFAFLLLLSSSLYAAPPYISNNLFSAGLSPQACASRAQLTLTQAGFNNVRTLPATMPKGSSQMIVGVIQNFKAIIRCIHYQPNQAWVMMLVAGPTLDVSGLNNRIINTWNSF